MVGKLVTGLCAAAPAAVTVSCVEPTMVVQPVTRCISSKMALSLAHTAIELEGGSPLTAKQLVAMAFQESSLNVQAVGDHGKAEGLFQFHKGTWNDHQTEGWQRTMPLESFRVAIRYAKRGKRLLARLPDGSHRVVERLWSHHNVGNVRRINERYVDLVFHQYSELNAGRLP